MEPEKENKTPEPTVPGKEETYNINKTVDVLHDEGVDILDDDRVTSYAAPQPSRPAPKPVQPLQSEPAQTPISPVPPASPTSSVPPVPPVSAAPSNNAGFAPMPPYQPAYRAPEESAATDTGASRNAQGDIDRILGMSMGAGAKPAQNVVNDPSIKPLRTFKSDAEEAIRYQNISTAQIAVAEHKKKEIEAAKPEEVKTIIDEEPHKKSSALPILFLTLILILLLGGGGYYYWFYVAPAGEEKPVVNVPKGISVKTLIPYSRADLLELRSDDDPLAVMGAKFSAAPLELGDIYALVPVPFGTTTSMASASSLFSKTHIPDMLKRSLGKEYMVGTYLYTANSPFVILKNTFFQNAYAGMLDWEGSLRNDFISLIRVTHPNEAPITVNTDVFEDTVVSNIDTRVLRGSSGQIILAYAFADKDTVVLATNTETLAYVLDKLLAVRVVQ